MENRCTILLIEDDEPCGGYLGYSKARVIGLGRRVRTKALAHADRISTGVDGHRLPDMPGVELAVKIKKDKPQIEAIYMSGYADNPDIRDDPVPT